jgi:ATP-binding cassette, subfamily B, bacterial
MVFRLRCRLFDHLQRLSLAFHDTTTVGDSLYRMTWDTYCVQSLFNSGVIPALTASFTLLGIAGIMFVLDWLLDDCGVGHRDSSRDLDSKTR